MQRRARAGRKQRFPSWLFQIARSAVAEHQRAHARHRLPDAPAESDLAAESTADDREAARSLAHARERRVRGRQCDAERAIGPLRREIERTLTCARGELRSEIARSLQRKRTPELRFAIGGPGGSGRLTEEDEP